MLSKKEARVSKYLIVGAGATGGMIAEQLAVRGHEATLVSRRGAGPVRDGVTRVALDATDAPRLAAVAAGAQAIFNCANPPYHRWSTDWPPLAHAMLAAAARSGATLVTLSNLYAYGPPSGPMRESDPIDFALPKAQVRADMWREALAAHEGGVLRAVEVRASDFIGPGADGVVGERVVPRVLAGRGVQLIGDLDVPHSLTYVGDVARTMIATSEDPGSWGRVWHVPTNPAQTLRATVNNLADAAGVERVRVTSLPVVALRLAGLFSPLMRELPKTLYQFQAPFVIDDSAARARFGLAPTPWSEVLVSCLRSFGWTPPSAA